jgi:sRNA-binding protein
MTSRQENIANTRRILAERFPGAFMGKGKWKRPLAIGIHQQVFEAAPDLTKTQIRRAIGDYCNGPMYQRNLKSGAQRVDIAGTGVDVVTPEQAQLARQLMHKRGWNKYKQRPVPLKRAA